VSKQEEYQVTIDWLFKQLPMYQNVGQKAYKKDLTNSLNLDKYLGHPHKSYPTIHVAGTNGKGTTCHMLAAVLQTAGYKVGLYTSPHLKDFRERIKINGEPISQLEVVDFVSEHKEYLQKNNLSFFEMTVGMAFKAFQIHNVDIAIIEVGLGGRLDSTNIITPILSVITSIDLDHTDILGNTLEEIAIEKAGILKQGVPVVINEHRQELRKLFKEIAKQNLSSVSFAFAKEETTKSQITTEEQNAQLAKLALQELTKNTEFQIIEENLKKGLYDYQKITGLLGRYQVLSENPKIIADVAHNLAGIQKLMNRLKEENYNQLHIIYGTVVGKNFAELIKALPAKAIYYLCASKNERSLPVNNLLEHFKENKRNAYLFQSVNDALHEAKKKRQ